MTGTTLKLRFARIHLGKQWMEVCLDDSLREKPRLVKYRWDTKIKTDVPPKTWYTSVLSEVKYQRGMDHKRRTGRALPGE